MKKVIISVISAVLMLGASPGRAAQAAPGSLVKGSTSAVYYLTGSGNRLAFPTESIFKTWYEDFSGVVRISDAELASHPLVGNVWYRPGSKMVKVRSAPQVYAVAANGVLRPITSENVARTLYGTDWNKKIADLMETVFINYKIGAPIETILDYSPSTEYAAISTIAANGAGASSVAVTAPTATGTASNASVSAAISDAASSSGRIMSIAIDPNNENVAYVGSASGGIYKTVNRGEKWFSVADNLNSMHIAALAIDPTDSNVVYAGTGETYMPGDDYGYNGVYVSKDAGANWSLMPGTQPLSLRAVSTIVVHPDNAKHVYLGTNAGIYETTNGGTNWKKIADGFIENLIVSDKNHNTLFATGSGTLIMRSKDMGANWEKLNGWGIYRGFPADNPWFDRVTITQSSGDTVLPNVEHVLYVALAEPYQLYRSDDEGDSWHEVAKQPFSGMRNYAVLADPNDADAVFTAGTYLNRATQGGWTVTPVSFPLFEIRAIAYAPSNPRIMYAATDTGMAVSVNGGLDWAAKNEGLDTTQWYALTVGKNGNVYGAVQDHSIMRYDNIWSDSSWGSFARYVIADPTRENVVYALATDLKGIGRSTDYGKHFTGINGHLNAGTVSVLAVDPTNGGTIYAASGTYVYRSTDSGDSWNGIGNGGSTAAVTSLTVSHSPDRVFVGRADGTTQTVAVGTNVVNASWKTVYTEPNKKPVAKIVASADTVTMAYNTDWGTRLVRLTEKFGTWKPADMTGDLPSGAWVRSMAMDILNQNTVYVGTLTGAFVGHQVATDKWVWTEINGIPKVEVTGIALDNVRAKAYFATWGRGLYEITK